MTIDGNRIFRSKHQLVFIQDAIGPISDVTVTNNTMVGAGATAVQIQGVPRLVFVHNTVWDGTLGGVWLRQGYLRAGVRAIPRDAIITDNILDCLRYMDGTGAAVEARNFIGWAIPYVNTLPVADPGFTDPLNDDYSIRPGGAAQGLGAL